MRLWKAFDFVRTRGKWYQISEGDGLLYSYSVYDNIHLLAEWADEILIFPANKSASRSGFHPLLTSSGVIVMAIRRVAIRLISSLLG